MTDHISQFIDALTAAGCAPHSASEIVADDKPHRYQVSGEKGKNASYQLGSDDDFGYGWFIHFKQHDKAIPWHSIGDKKNLSPAELKARKTHLAKVKREREKQEAIEFAAVAKEAKKIWSAATEQAHPYLDKKSIAADGTRVTDLTDGEGRVQKDILLIPMYIEGRLSSLQRIWPNGFKAFLEGGNVKGAYTAFVNPDEDKSTIIITEGYATGRTIRDALGLPTIVAFNAGNIMAVARFFRNKYPKSRIVIAADNDQWTLDNRKRPDDLGETKPKDIEGDDPRWMQWREEGRLFNPGVEKAQQAAAKVGAHVIWPDIAPDDKGKNTDFNDLCATNGIDAVRERILVAAPTTKPQDRDGGGIDSTSAVPPLIGEDGQEVPPHYFDEIPDAHYEEVLEQERSIEQQRLYGNEVVVKKDLTKAEYGAFDHISDEKEIETAAWSSMLEYNEDEQLKSNSLHNAKLLIENLERYKGMFCYDEFSQEKVVTRCPPWESKPKKFKPRTLRDEDKTELTMDLEKRRIRISIMNIAKVLDAVVIRNNKNPAQEYFKSLEWDGVPRLATWLRTYAGCVEEDPEYLAAIGTKWLCAAVGRVMNPGCKFDHILILEGEQSLGKSPLFKILATIHGREYFDDTIKARDLGSERIIMKLQGCLIIELAEMVGFDKMSDDEAKQAISSQKDRIIKKYHNEPTELPRQFVFAGTTNKYNYLNDPSGNKRYWPAKATNIDLELLKKDQEQLWAEAYDRWSNGEKLWLSDAAVYKKAELEQNKRLNIHAWQPDLERLTSNSDRVTYDEIWDALIISDRTRRTADAQATISMVMRGLGFEVKSEKQGRSHLQVWKRKAAPDFFDQMQPTTNEKEEEIPWQ